MTSPLLPPGTHVMKLKDVLKSKYGPLGAQCIFEPVGEFAGCYTISRFISRFGKWAKSSDTLIDQLKGFNYQADITSELRRFVGLKFLCEVKEGKGHQRNISRFIDPNINSKRPSADETLPGNLNELR
jgi:hypothetical protein